MTKRYQIPYHNEMPSEEMIDWLGEMTQEWEGDSSGISIQYPDGSVHIGSPGDYVVEENGVYRIEAKK